MKIKEKLEQQKVFLVNSYLDGVSTCELGRHLGCSNASIYVFLRDVCKVKIRQAPKIADYHNEIARLVQQGLSGCKIADQLDLPSTSVRRYMAKHKLKISDWKPHEYKLDDYTDKIIQMYQSGYSADKIGKKFGYHETSILEFLRKQDVEIHNIRTYFFDETFFECINTEAKAYILGFACGDSYNSDDAFITCITDREIVEIIKKEMKYEGDIKVIQPKYKHRKVQYKLAISSRKLCKDLCDKGCMRAKTHILKFPSIDKVPEHLLHHWCRGLFDADGTLGKYNKLSLSITGSKYVLEGLRNYLLSKFDYGGSMCLSYKYSTDIYKWSAGGDIACKKFAHFIYDDATIYLKRKYDIAQQYFLNSEISR